MAQRNREERPMGMGPAEVNRGLLKYIYIYILCRPRRPAAARGGQPAARGGQPAPHGGQPRPKAKAKNAAVKANGKGQDSDRERRAGRGPIQAVPVLVRFLAARCLGLLMCP